MGLFVGGVPVKQVYVGSTPVTAVYVGSEKIWPTAEVHEVTLTDVSGNYAEHPLVTVTVPAGESWQVRIQGTVTKAASQYAYRPFFRIGTTETGPYAQGATVDMTGTVTSTNPKIIMITMPVYDTSFTGTVTIEK